MVELFIVVQGLQGRIGVQEMEQKTYPTFGWPKNELSFIIAGGKKLF